MQKNIKIGKKIIGDKHLPYIIAEVAQAHDGSLGMAHSYIDAAAEAGVDAIKFQTHFAEQESTFNDKFRIRFSYEDKNRFEYWKRIEFDKSGWEKLKKYAEKKGLTFLSSPFSLKAVNLLSSLNVSAWKIGSGEVQNFEMLSQIKLSKKPILISNGMSTESEIKKTLKFLNKKNVALLYCVSSYPSKNSEIDINEISLLKKKFKVPVGFSDHSGSIYPSQIAMCSGANLVEVHVNFDRKMFGPDSSSSVTFEELKKIVEFKKNLFEIKLKKKKIKKNYRNKKLFNRSYALKIDLNKGSKIKFDHLTLKKPGGGISYFERKKIIGKTLKKNKSKNRLLRLSDFK